MSRLSVQDYEDGHSCEEVVSVQDVCDEGIAGCDDEMEDRDGDEVDNYGGDEVEDYGEE